MAVGNDGHIAGTHDHFPHVLMDDRFMGRDKDASVFLARRKGVFMNVFVDRTADSVQTIVAVREDAGHRKFLEPAGNGRLQDAT